MGIILYTYPFKDPSLRFERPWCPTIYPYTQSVNRVRSDLDPFQYINLCEPISEIKSLPTSKLSFSDMCLARAENLNKTVDKNIYLYYSGGMDSAAAFLAFRKVMSKQDLKKLHIVASHQSILEFPEMWTEIHYAFEGRIISSYANMEDLARDGVVVTGQHADHLLGSDNIKRVHSQHGNEGITMPWRDAMLPIYTEQFGESIARKFIEVYGETTSECPFPIVTAYDWVWWFGFTNKWQHAKYKFLGYKPWKNPAKTYKNVIHFFDTPEWQKWSLDNHDLKVVTKMRDYKRVIRDFVINESGYQSYSKKRKEASLRMLWYNKEFAYGISDDFSELTKEQCLEHIGRLPQ